MNIKKAFAAGMAVMVFLGTAAYMPASSATKTASSQTKETDTVQPPVSGIPGPVLQAKSAILVEQSTGKILYEKNAHEKLPPASITKIMTELLTLDAIEDGTLKWDEILTCSAHAASMGGSDIWLEPGEKMSVKDLFKAMAISIRKRCRGCFRGKNRRVRAGLCCDDEQKGAGAWHEGYPFCKRQRA